MRRVVCVWAITVLVLGSCRPPAATTPGPTPAPAPAPPPADGTHARATVPLDGNGGTIVIGPSSASAHVTPATIEPLSATDTDALLARLSPMPDRTGKVVPTIRPPSAAPPRTGNVTPIAFVAPTGKAVPDAPVVARTQAPVLSPPQITPDGPVDYGANVRVRFAEPMVPVAEVGSAAPPGIALQPAVAGHWRWLDTRVVEFEPDAARLPGSTPFQVTVPAGTRAVSGATLAADARGTFSTSPIRIFGAFPYAIRPDSAIAIRVDQEADPARFPLTVLANGKPVRFHIVDDATARGSWVADRTIQPTADQLGTFRVDIAPDTAWPAGTALDLVLAKGAGSREGPLVSTQVGSARVTVVRPFSLVGIACDGKPATVDARCPAESGIGVEFTNAIDEASYHPEKIRFEGQAVQDSYAGESVYLVTPAEVGKTFAVAIADDLRDVHGQPLVGLHHPRVTTGPVVYDPELEARTGLFVLDPRYTVPQWSVTAEAVKSVRVQLYRVTPADYFAFEDYERGTTKTPPGTRVFDNTYAIGPIDGATWRVDLRPALAASGVGHVVAVATVVADKRPLAGRPLRVAWIEVSRLGLTARMDGERVHAWVADLAPDHFLAPRAGVSTAFVVDGRTDAEQPATSDADGHAVFSLWAPATKQHRAIVLATDGDDRVFAAVDRYERAIRVDDARWYVTDDRFLYKPGETVYLKGWVRWTDNGVNPDIHLPNAGETVAYTVVDSRGVGLATGSALLTDQGGFDAAIALPANANLGTAHVTLQTRTAVYTHPLKIEEFRTPAYEVTLNDDVTHGRIAPVYAGEQVEMAAEAKYYAGGGLPGAAIEWSARLTAASYRPPNWDGFWFAPPRRVNEDYDGSYEVTAAHRDTLSSASTSTTGFGIASTPLGRPAVLVVDATVEDVDRAHIRASSHAILVHPSTLYVGLHAAADDRVEAIVTDIDGHAVSGVPIDLVIQGRWASERSRPDAVQPVADQHCALTSGTAPVQCPFTRDAWFAYTATAKVADARGRANVTQYPIPWFRPPDEHTFGIVADKLSYKPGDVAKLTVTSNVVPATAVVTFARQGVIAQKKIQLTHAATVVELPIEPAFIENVHVQIERMAERVHHDGDGPIPEVVTAETDLHVDVESARLAMTATAVTPLVEPGGEATFAVTVRHGGEPVANAEVALMVVDEAVLALADGHHADPLPGFYRRLGAGTEPFDTMNLVDDAGPDTVRQPGFETYKLAGRGGGTGSGSIGSGQYGTIGHGSGAGSGIVTAREDFRANAVFSPQLHTDKDGRVEVTVRMPDNLTRFRVVAIATADMRYFGKAEGSIVVQRKVNARTVAPRFLSQGDAFSLPVVVQNLDGKPRTIDVAVRAANLVASGPMGRRVTVPAGQRAEVRFDFATRARGLATIQTIIASGDRADATNLDVPVYAPATTEAFATYGTVDDGAAFEQLAVPGDVYPDVGGVDVELASSQLQSLTDAYWYLYAYPHECNEQRSSRMIATAAIYDILDAFESPDRPSRADIDAQRAADVEKLADDQHADGSWGYFPGMAADPFVTMQVLTALGKDKSTTVTRAQAFVAKQVDTLLASIERDEPKDRALLPYRVSLAAAGVAALAASGRDELAHAQRLHAAAIAHAAYPIDAKARLLAVVAKNPRAADLRARLLKDVLDATQETASSATVTAQYVEAERLLLVSNTKTDALALDALIREKPDLPIIAKLARGVLDGRRHGRWSSTQDNLVALVALRRYFDAYEKTTPDYTGKVWIGTAGYTERAFAGHTGDIAAAHLDFHALAPGSTHDVAIEKDGAGRLYYRLGIAYAPARADVPALDAGFIVRRVYTPLDDPGDVTRTATGYRIKLGARVRVTIEELNASVRYGVALVDPLPAGFEAINDRLAVTERVAAVPDDTRWDFTNLRDDRSEAFAMSLGEGRHQLSYTVRAATPGTFRVAPAKAEEMYTPETFGRSTGEIVVIE